MGAQSERIDSRTTLTWRPKGHAVGAAVGMRAVTVLARAPVAMVVAMKMASPPMCYVFDISRYLTGCWVALGTLVVSISRLTPTNILRICYDSCIYILYDAQV